MFPMGGRICLSTSARSLSAYSGAIGFALISTQAWGAVWAADWGPPGLSDHLLYPILVEASALNLRKYRASIAKFPLRHQKHIVLYRALARDAFSNEAIEFGIVERSAALASQHVFAALGEQVHRLMFALRSFAKGFSDNVSG